MNPLSDARRGRSKTKRQATKDDTAQDIWFRKSQMGYRCFVDYYVMQTGLWQASNESHTPHPPSPHHNTNVRPSQKKNRNNNSSVGLSRAAKRRKKKKGVAVPLNTSTTFSPGLDSVQQSVKESDFSQHPLWLAWRAFAETPPSCYSNRTALGLLFETLSRPLPFSFRIRLTADAASSASFREEIDSFNERDTNLLVQSMHSSVGARSTSHLAELEYYQAECSKQALTDVRFKESLLVYSQNGTVARQEVGSMLPVAALHALGCFDLSDRAKKPLCVLDMCASPGSKTLQALEALSGSKYRFGCK
jgi:16S rRNA C967 or C1407 C5-methylase (RsmB/RsmF family)